MTMIISASRRTDIPAFYADWFINRIRAGYCTVPNPHNPKQVSRVSLLPEDVDVIVFWTRNPKPMFPYLDELCQRGYRFYYQYTLIGYPREIDPRSPSRQVAIETLRELSDRIGHHRVIWRYDPIVFSRLTGAAFHSENYACIAEALCGYTTRSVISVMDMYNKIRKRIEQLDQQGVGVVDHDGRSGPRCDDLMNTIAQTAREHDMQIFSCAEERDLEPCGILPGKCIDDDYIKTAFRLEVGHKKDPGQRQACGCVVSRDIGAYNTCVFGCNYCYATGDFEHARANLEAHDPQSPSLLNLDP